MPREVITLQIGQCGNQIGNRFWELALREHAAHCRNGLFDESLSSLFRNVDSRFDDPVDIPVGNGQTPIRCLKARAILIDMEEGVVSETMKGPLGELFDSHQLLTDVSGCGNNWAQGYGVYGPKYENDILDKLQRAAEHCDSLQSFLLLHSLGGGTGSGVGTYILHLLEDNFSEAFRFSCPVFPSEDDDVVTSPYNSVLSLKQLIDHADCVTPVENQALLDLCQKAQPTKSDSVRGGVYQTWSSIPAHEKGSKPFDAMNGVIAQMLCGLTSSVRFEGSLNVDLNEITVNLVPYPRMHFLIPAITPLSVHSDLKIQQRRIGQMFFDIMSPHHQLMRADPKQHTYLALALLARGKNVTISDMQRNLGRIRSDIKMVHWNSEGFKIGLCHVPPAGHDYSMLSLSNNSAIGTTFMEMSQRLMRLFRRRAHLHHYTNIIDLQMIQDAVTAVDDIANEYSSINTVLPPSQSYGRILPML